MVISFSFMWPRNFIFVVRMCVGFFFFIRFVSFESEFASGMSVLAQISVMKFISYFCRANDFYGEITGWLLMAEMWCSSCNLMKSQAHINDWPILFFCSWIFLYNLQFHFCAMSRCAVHRIHFFFYAKFPALQFSTNRILMQRLMSRIKNVTNESLQRNYVCFGLVLSVKIYCPVDCIAHAKKAAAAAEKNRKNTQREHMIRYACCRCSSAWLRYLKRKKKRNKTEAQAN